MEGLFQQSDPFKTKATNLRKERWTAESSTTILNSLNEEGTYHEEVLDKLRDNFTTILKGSLRTIIKEAL